MKEVVEGSTIQLRGPRCSLMKNLCQVALDNDKHTYLRTVSIVHVFHKRMGLYCRVAEEVILTRAMGDLLMKVVERTTIWAARGSAA